jgi:membrane protein
VKLLKKTFDAFAEDECMSGAAAISYYAIFSIPALLVIIINIAGFFLGQRQVGDEVRTQIASYIGPSVADQVIRMAEAAGNNSGGGLVTTIIGVIALMFGATGVFVQLQTSLNKAWDVEPRPDQGVIEVAVKQRAVGFLEVLGLAVILMLYIVLTTADALQVLVNWLPEGWSQATFQTIAFLSNLGALTVLFAGLFKSLPDAEIRWRVVWLGAFVTAALFTLGQILIGLYFGHANIAGAYGAAGSLALLMVWIYYSSILMLFGAGFSHAWAQSHGIEAAPSKGARRVVWRRQEARG